MGYSTFWTGEVKHDGNEITQEEFQAFIALYSQVKIEYGTHVRLYDCRYNPIQKSLEFADEGWYYYDDAIDDITAMTKHFNES